MGGGLGRAQNFTGCMTEGQFEHNGMKLEISENYKKAEET